LLPLSGSGRGEGVVGFAFEKKKAEKKKREKEGGSLVPGIITM